MIRHMVMFKFKPEVSADDRAAFREMLHKLADDIDLIQALETGENVVESPRACDMVLMVDVADEAALQAYAKHPDHQPVLQRAGEIISVSYVVDYPLPN